MAELRYDFKSGILLSTKSILIWRIAQLAVWLVGAVILSCLLFFPSLGVLLFWNILIPVAPLLFVLWVGVWRNVCPLATTNLLPRHLGWSKKKRLSSTQLGKLNLVGVIALFLLVPLRHAIFNNNGTATGIMIVSMAFIGVIMGFFYEWKSAWCSGLCPIHPVEKLYGGNTIMSLPNVHCDQCRNCVIPCPDSTPNINPNIAKKNKYASISGLLITGGLPGFIWGWFHVPDQLTAHSLSDFLSVYQLPFLGFFITLFIYWVLSSRIQLKYERKLVSIFATAGVSCYYWYRIPALFGFGKYNKDGLLIDLSHVLPVWSITSIIVSLTLFFFYWLVIRRQNNQSWVVRPPYANKEEKLKVTLYADV